MTRDDPGPVTHLLAAWRRGEDAARERLAELVYEELRRLARRALRGEDRARSLETTELVHEACLRLLGEAPPTLHDRAHLYAVAAQAMRHLLIDHARRHRYQKRGGGARPLALEEVANTIVAVQRPEELLRLDDALRRLAAADARKARIVEMRHFAGMTIRETAEVLGVAPVTVAREWRLARSWLYRELGGAGERAR